MLTPQVRVGRSVAFVLDDRSTAGRETGQLPVSSFVSDDFSKDGTWLGSPQAVREPPLLHHSRTLLGMHSIKWTSCAGGCDPVFPNGAPW